MNILLLGANERACYSLAKMYARNGCRVSVLNDGYHPIAHSRFVKEFIKIKSSFLCAVPDAAAEVEKVLAQNTFDCLIPIDDIAVALCIRYIRHWSVYTKILNINAPDTERFCVNKYDLLQLAANEGLPTPKTLLVTEISDIDCAVSRCNFPVIAKPVQSKKMIGTEIYSYSVKKFSNSISLTNFLREKIPCVPVMLQEVLGEGFGVGYNFLSKEGEIIQAYAHQRLNEEWGGGQSSYRKSIPTDQYGLEELSKRIIKKINWNGIAMIEYRVINNTPFIMEINGRPWGSIEVGTYSGVPLALSLVDTFVKQNKIAKVAFREVYVRNLYNDFIWILKSKSPGKILSWVFSLRTSFRRNNYIEDSLFEDPGFRLRYILHHIREVIVKVRRQKLIKIFPVHISSIKPGILTKDSKIAFICKGNINRSAFAEKYFSSKYSTSVARVDSYGLIHESNRLPPLQAVKSAANLGINLESHRSKYITSHVLADYDFFIVMDRLNYDGLKRMKIPSNKIFLLEEKEIEDPYGQDQITFDKVFLRIKENIDKLCN